MLRVSRATPPPISGFSHQTPAAPLTPRCVAPSQLQTPATLSLPPHTAALAPSAAQRQRPTSSLARGAAHTAMWRPVTAPKRQPTLSFVALPARSLSTIRRAASASYIKPGPRRRLTPRCGAPSQLTAHAHPESSPALIYTAAPASHTPPAAHHLQPTPLDAPRHIAVLHRPAPKLLRRLSVPVRCQPRSARRGLLRRAGSTASAQRRPLLPRASPAAPFLHADAACAFCGGHAALRASRVLPTEPGSNNTLELQALMPPSCTPTAGGSRSSSPSCR
jgi:hypothetical protein